jgi:hypothetical protein
LGTAGFAPDLHVSLSIFMIALLLALCAQAEGPSLVVTIAADGPLVRTQPTALILEAQNSGAGGLDDVELTLEVNSADAGIGVTAGCNESDDGETQTVVCPIGAMARNTSVSLQLDIVPSQEGELRVTLRGTTATLGEDASDNEIVGVFAVAPFVATDDDDGDGDGGCASSAAGSLAALAALMSRRKLRPT